MNAILLGFPAMKMRIFSRSGLSMFSLPAAKNTKRCHYGPMGVSTKARTTFSWRATSRTSPILPTKQSLRFGGCFSVLCEWVWCVDVFSVLKFASRFSSLGLDLSVDIHARVSAECWWTMNLSCLMKKLTVVFDGTIDDWWYQNPVRVDWQVNVTKKSLK